MKAYNLSTIDVLLVDDHKFTLSFMREILRTLGVREVRVTEDADSALKMSAEFRPDIIFCDFEMPSMNGLEFIQRVRNGASKWDVRIPIVTLTSFTEQNRIYESRDAGASHYLAKPVSPTSVYNRMVRIIEENRPFVTTDTYKGPDRRRKRVATPYAGKERRQSETNIAENPDVSISQDEMDVLFNQAA